MGVWSNTSRLIPVGSRLVCADNSGARVLSVVGVLGTQGTRKRRLSCGVGSIVVVTVKKGDFQMKKKVRYALVIRQKYAYLRKTGPHMGRVKFQDNAAILLSEKKEVLKSVIKGVVAKEVSRVKKFSELNAVLR